MKPEDYKYWGVDFRLPHTRHKTEEQIELAKYCETGRGLDIGCGNLKCHENCMGVDIHPDSKAEVKHDCRDLSMYNDNEFDFLVSSHVLEHMPDFIAVLRGWQRVLKPGGIMGVAVPDGELKPKYIGYNGHKVNLGLNTLRFVFKRMLGMKIIRMGHVEKAKKNAIVAIIVAKKVN